MQYTTDEFVRLMAVIEEQGGKLEEGIHEDRYVRYEDNGLHRAKGIMIPGCHFESVFSFPAPTEDETTVTTITACACCDHLGNWPRFAKAGLNGR